MGSERPENCPVDSFQWRTGGSPGKGVATIEDADICRKAKATWSPVVRGARGGNSARGARANPYRKEEQSPLQGANL